MQLFLSVFCLGLSADFISGPPLISLFFFQSSSSGIRNALAARKHVAAARSPLFSTLGDATSGVVVIRAFGRQRAFASPFMVQNDTCNKVCEISQDSPFPAPR